MSTSVVGETVVKEILVKVAPVADRINKNSKLKLVVKWSRAEDLWQS